MKYDFGVTIATSLATGEICTNESFQYIAVLDLRCCENSGPHAIEEQIFKRLRFCHITFHQLPTNLHTANTRQQNELYALITGLRGRVLVITDHPELLNKFCEGLDIPCTNRIVHHLEPANDVMPFQIKLSGQK